MLTMVDDTTMGYALGASGYLTKPIDHDRLLRTLEAYRQIPRRGPVLIVEDDAAARERLRHMLEREGWSVSEADNGRVALQRIAWEQPAVILLDLMMPEMDGFAFVLELRKDQAWRSVPIIVITARDVSLQDRLRLNGHVQKILNKGALSQEQLLQEVRDLVEDCIRRGHRVAQASDSNRVVEEMV
jgi:CheY-like chemotaxis protein